MFIFAIFAMMIFAVSLGIPSVTHAESTNQSTNKVIKANQDSIVINGVEYSKHKNSHLFNQIKQQVKYTILDTNGKTYGYLSKDKYKLAIGHFSDKWACEQTNRSKFKRASAPGVSEFFNDANFQGFLFQQGVGFEWNIPFNDVISSLKTAGESSGTEVCYNSFRGEPCKTFPPGQDIAYVGDGWNDQISYVHVLR
ncbi:hypothetical protein [Fictibacillus sp. NRS-1165]|uniref:hypothetical protein n=1 Tax=Fictibacillus sp. NRS-1165 TaxID=3144463 RepID=UPI003D262325